MLGVLVLLHGIIVRVFSRGRGRLLLLALLMLILGSISWSKVPSLGRAPAPTRRTSAATWPSWDCAEAVSSSRIKQLDALCHGRTRVVTAGYSQGAMALHLALEGLSPRRAGSLVCVDLFCDPLRRRGQAGPDGRAAVPGVGIARARPRPGLRRHQRLPSPLLVPAPRHPWKGR